LPKGGGGPLGGLECNKQPQLINILCEDAVSGDTTSQNKARKFSYAQTPAGKAGTMTVFPWQRLLLRDRAKRLNAANRRLCVLIEGKVVPVFK
jgi:hypothetical protein